MEMNFVQGINLKVITSITLLFIKNYRDNALLSLNLLPDQRIIPTKLNSTLFNLA